MKRRGRDGGVGRRDVVYISLGSCWIVAHPLFCSLSFIVKHQWSYAAYLILEQRGKSSYVHVAFKLDDRYSLSD